METVTEEVWGLEGQAREGLACKAVLVQPSQGLPLSTHNHGDPVIHGQGTGALDQASRDLKWGNL